MSNKGFPDKSLTDSRELVRKEITDTLKLLKGVSSAVKGIENKLKILQKKASESTESSG